MTAATNTARGIWQGCDKCGATTRHDDGMCYRDTRSPIFDVRRGFSHTPQTPSMLERLAARRRP